MDMDTALKGVSVDCFIIPCFLNTFGGQEGNYCHYFYGCYFVHVLYHVRDTFIKYFDDDCNTIAEYQY